MKVFIDTNIIVSSILFHGSKMERAFKKCILNNDCYISNQVISELNEVFIKKFSSKQNILKILLKK